MELSSSVQSLSCVQLFATPWTAAHQASQSITNSWSLLKLMSSESVMPSNRLILCHPLLLPHSIFPSIRVFSNESALHIRWPQYWSFSFSISSSNDFLEDELVGSPSSLVRKRYSFFVTRPTITRQHIKKQRHNFVNKGLSSQGYGFSSGHVWM